MALDTLGSLAEGLLGLFEIVGQGGPRSARFLVIAWFAVLALAGAFWHWHAAIVERFGGLAAVLAVVWALFGIYLIGASISSVGRALARPPS
jgi:hypothetical protein